MNLAEKLIGKSDKCTFEQRIFYFGLLLGVAVTAIGSILDFYYQVNPAVDLVFTCFWTAAYFIARFKGHYNMVSMIAFLVLILVFLPYQWLVSGGLLSAIPIYAILFLATECVVLSGRFRILMVLGTFVVILLLTLLDAHSLGSLTSHVQRRTTLLENLIHLVIVMGSIAVLLTVYSEIYIKEKTRSEAYAKAIEQIYKQQLYYMGTLEGVIAKLKSERHDWSNNLGVIYGLLENDENGKAKSYTSTLVQTAQKYRSLVNVPYSMLRAMLNYKLSIAKDRGIELRMKVNIPEGLALCEADLTVIVGNLLDNAMEANASVAEACRYIRLEMLCRRDYLVIQVENPFVQTRINGGIGKTSKADGENHGFGLRNIEYLVNKNDGLMKHESQDGIFRVRLALVLNPIAHSDVQEHIPAQPHQR